MKLWVGQDFEHTNKQMKTHTHTDRVNSLGHSAILCRGHKKDIIVYFWCLTHADYACKRFEDT